MYRLGFLVFVYRYSTFLPYKRTKKTKITCTMKRSFPSVPSFGHDSIRFLLRTILIFVCSSALRSIIIYMRYSYPC